LEVILTDEHNVARKKHACSYPSEARETQ